MQGLSTSQVILHFDLATDSGPRERNEDSAIFSPYGNFFAIADGIGGAPLGDIASKLACYQAIGRYGETGSILDAFDHANSSLIEFKQALRAHDLSNCSIGSLLPPPYLNRVFRNRYFNDASSTSADRRTAIGGIGSTLLLAHYDGEAMNFAWAGDTAAFRLRDGALGCVAQADNVNGTNQLGSAVGYEREIIPLQACCDVRAGDRFLLCTDGVWAELGENRLAEMLAQSADEEQLAKGIVEEAAANGHDNATVFVIIFEKNGGAADGESAEDSEGCEGCEGCEGSEGSADAGALQEDADPNIPEIPCTPTYPAISY